MEKDDCGIWKLADKILTPLSKAGAAVHNSVYYMCSHTQLHVFAQLRLRMFTLLRLRMFTLLRLRMFTLLRLDMLANWQCGQFRGIIYPIGDMSFQVRTTGAEKQWGTVMLSCHQESLTSCFIGKTVNTFQDIFCAHIIYDVKVNIYLSLNLVTISGGLTKVLQPIDIAINCPSIIVVLIACDRWMTSTQHINST